MGHARDKYKISHQDIQTLRRYLKIRANQRHRWASVSLTSALVSQLPDPIEDQVHELLADGVMTAGVVVRRVFLSRDQLLGME